MTGWKRAVGLTAMFVAMACVSFAAEGAGRKAAGGPGGEGRAERRAKALQAAAGIVDKYVAKVVGLDAAKTEMFVAAMAAERESFDKKMVEAQKAGGGADSKALTRIADGRTLMAERTKGIEAVVDANMTPEQAKKAKEIIGDMGLEYSVRAMLEVKVEPAKIEQAMPILVQYSKASSELRAKMRAKEISGEDVKTKSEELRAATARDLTPIVGEAGVAAWRAQRGYFGIGDRALGGATKMTKGEKPASEKPAKEKGEKGTREKGAREKGAKKRGGEHAPDAPVAPVAP